MGKKKQHMLEQQGQYAEGVSHDSEYAKIQVLNAERDAATTPAEKIDAYLKAKGLFIVGNWIPCTSEFIAFVEDNGFRKGYAAAMESLKSNNEKEDVEMNAQEMKSLLNEVLDAREAKDRKIELEIARETTRQMELKVRELEAKVREMELAEETKKSFIPEFDLDSFMPAKKSIKERATELGIDWEEVQSKSQLVQNFIYVSDEEEPVRKGVIRKSIENVIDIEIVETMNELEGKFEEVLEDGPSTPIRYIDGHCTIAWLKVIKADKFDETIIPVIQYAKNVFRINVEKAGDFKNWNSFFNSAYQYFTQVHPGRGQWKEFVKKHFAE